ncbi:MAG: hypothetical protein ACM30I_07560 [Gemmatimonas sp.]
MATLPTRLDQHRPSLSAFGWSAPARIAAVGIVAAVLWLAVAWALGVLP